MKNRAITRLLVRINLVMALCALVAIHSLHPFLHSYHCRTTCVDGDVCFHGTEWREGSARTASVGQGDSFCPICAGLLKSMPAQDALAIRAEVHDAVLRIPCTSRLHPTLLGHHASARGPPHRA